jgi:hypothetical protein
MAESTTQTTEKKTAAGASEKTGKSAATAAKAKLARHTVRALGRRKKKEKLQADSAFAKSFFEAKSKRSADKKAAFRKKKRKK